MGAATSGHSIPGTPTASPGSLKWIWIASVYTFTSRSLEYGISLRAPVMTARRDVMQMAPSSPGSKDGPTSTGRASIAANTAGDYRTGVARRGATERTIGSVLPDRRHLVGVVPFRVLQRDVEQLQPAEESRGASPGPTPCVDVRLASRVGARQAVTSSAATMAG